MEMCDKCQAGAKGDIGHDGLKFYVGGPFPGQSIFKCDGCGERWIRHHSLTDKYGWTRYFLQFSGQKREPITTGKKPAPTEG